VKRPIGRLVSNSSDEVHLDSESLAIENPNA